MTGKRVKEILRKNGYVLSDVAKSMGIIPQNLQSMLNVEDIKTGVLERVAAAINQNVYFFYQNDVKLPSSDAIKKMSDNHIGNMMDIAAKLGIGQREPEPSLPPNDDTAQLWEMIGFLKKQIETQNRIIEELTKKVGNDAPRRVARAGE
uniref:hypothetical protein n=1 Tax=Alistipes sp. D31t1_170403_E11 TaxID=2787128 RepID=UPI0018978122|nr:hypothetical protein [Alistipes sp. D31t1_170403_E11]